MVSKTEQKFLDAALEIFAEKGYKGATTRLIAQKAGFSELTLFRKFKTKENLFNSVLTHNIEKVKADMTKALEANISTDEEVFLTTLITDMAGIAEKNYEFILLSSTQKDDPMREVFVEYLSKCMEKHLPGRDISYRAFGLSIYSYTFMITQTKHYEQGWFNYERALSGFIQNAFKIFSL
ncbi:MULTISPECIES: TetR/AcrR family transcriptional regulator [Methanobacterium]|jgi:AcrR family transcriptional regulator|nr:MULTISPECIES: TetR/AcrR family transcriptional regulator [Methanobacterium]KUK74700.1 MAG: Transcriptional regulator [Methanobacterium sp. 42_16]MDD4809933.1 TetR/AcrR family transcriptional regulator [Methanobacterium formicicum]MDG3546954.1 TetR/AcrR family transcriptional regulator [Methanobacterium formicicum]